jgi:alkylation response protein AidB-like acyl-CoA dehydrogenase
MQPYRDLDLTLTTEHVALKAGVHAFARDVVRPSVLALDQIANPNEVIRRDSLFWTTLQLAYQQRFHTALVPAECGGLGLKGVNMQIALEELAWGSADFAITVAISGFPFALVAATATKELIEEFVAPFVNDTSAHIIGCWAITEPNHGSDHFMPGTPQFSSAAISPDVVAEKRGNEYIINGAKSSWISNGTIATHALLYLGLDKSRGMAGNGIAIVPLNLPGVTKEKALDKLGQRGLNQGGISFTNVRVPQHYMIVGPEGYEQMLRLTLSLTNAAMGAVFTGVARAAYEEALASTRTRVQGGKPICEHQLVQRQLFDMYTKVQNCRLLSRSAMAYNDGTRPPALEQSIAAKVYCTQAAYEVADAALQLFGARGLCKGMLIEKLHRDARASLIEDGANDVLALVGANEILKSEKS